MMMDCPRCGFVQEKDQYCASCGVDMIAFRPAEKPLTQRILRSTVFQLIAFAVLVLVMFSFARRLRHREIAERIAEVESSRTTQVLSARTQTKKTEMSSTAPVETPAQAAAATESAAAVAPVMASTPQADKAPASDDAKTNAAGVTNRTANSARIVFASLSKGAIADLVASTDPRFASTQGPITTGVVPNLASRMKAAQASDGWSILEQSVRSIRLNQLVEYYGGTRDEANNQFLGFVMELTPTALDENMSTLQFRAWRYLHDSSGQIDEFSVPLPEAFTVPVGGGVYILNTLPKRALADAERRFYEPLKVLSLMSTDDYRSGASDLVIFIEPK